MRKIYLKPLLTSLIFIGGFLIAAGQHPAREKNIDTGLVELSKKLSGIYYNNLAEGLKLAEKNNWKLAKEGDGSFLGLYQGFPVYFKTDNREAAWTISTHELWTGGSLGLNLNGENMLIGEWDGGLIRESHQEFENRGTQKDGANNLSDHATHVGVTLVGKGVNAGAKGMSAKALLDAYYWDNDESEMASAAANGLLISNHSYGLVTGWWEDKTENKWKWLGDTTISSQVDWKYGYYDWQSKDWDEIAFNAPNYLIFKSAGNDRGSKLPAGVSIHYVFDGSLGDWVESSTSRAEVGQYDCISGSGLAKNVMTVGAVNPINAGYSQSSDVVMSSFSGWGPTDDGRIKPDIVANGVNVFSALSGSDNAYGSYNGTSMATPNAAGSALLLQQLYKEKYGVFMRSASLKGLIIHNADEAGNNEGPDYRFGWGLMNTEKSAVHLLNLDSLSLLKENYLAKNDTDEIIVYSDGLSPLKASIVWTDPASFPRNPALDDRTAHLINDLDIRIISVDNSNTFLPWKLDPNNPTAAATRADNNVDNVEQVLINNPSAGFYKIRISHKSGLTGNGQNYSLLVSGISAGLEARISGLTSGCKNTDIAFKDESFGGPVNFDWYSEFAIIPIKSGKNISYKFSDTGLFEIRLIASNASGSVKDTTYHQIRINDLPEVELTSPMDSVCKNADPFNMVGIPSGGVFELAGGSLFNPSLFPDNFSVLKIYSITDQNGCKNSDSITIFVKAIPLKPTITRVGDSLIASINSSGIYRWYFNNNLISGENKNSLYISNSGVYYVESGNNLGCFNESNSSYFAGVGINRINNEIKIYPNPFKNRIIIENAEIIERIRLYDLQGKLLIEKELKGNKELELEEIQNNGIFLIEINYKSGEISYQKIIKQ